MPRNKPESADPLPPLVVPGDDSRAKMYDKIAQVHKNIVEAKWRARTAKMQIKVHPSMVMHHEDAIAFLAEEVLTLRSIVEDKLKTSIKEAVFEAMEHVAPMAEAAIAAEGQQEDGT